jgi:hypothetical protein
MATTTTKRQRDQILRERISGAKLDQIARRHRMSIEGVRAIAVKEGRRHVDDLERRLRANVGTDDVEGFLIPGHGGPDFDAALAYLRWALAQLSDRGIQTRIHYRPTQQGVVFGVEIAEGGDA